MPPAGSMPQVKIVSSFSIKGFFFEKKKCCPLDRCLGENLLVRIFFLARELYHIFLILYVQVIYRWVKKDV